MTGQRRIGHSGTLDPMATGLLVVFLGRATRAVEFAEGHDKAYTALLRPGVVTDTLDTTGAVLATSPERPTRSELEAALGAFRGEIEQLPPMYSALKYNGKKLYEIARAGGEVERKPRPVTIYRLECTGERGRGLRARGGVLQGHLHTHALRRHRPRAGLRGLHVGPAPDARGRL